MIVLTTNQVWNAAQDRLARHWRLPREVECADEVE